MNGLKSDGLNQPVAALGSMGCPCRSNGLHRRPIDGVGHQPRHWWHLQSIQSSQMLNDDTAVFKTRYETQQKWTDLNEMNWK